MPYTNVPKDQWDEMDACVESVMGDRDIKKERAIAICHASIVDDKQLSHAIVGAILSQLSK